jgi:hypothetical protein
MPYQKLVEVLAARRDPGVPPLYQLGFNYVPGGFDDDTGTAEDDMMLEVANVSGRLQYNTALFDAATATALTSQYQTVLAAVLADPSLRLSALPVDAVAPVPAPESTTTAKAYVAPRTAAEELVAEVWQEVLGIPQAGAFDDFFDLGGHSLLALRVIARLDATTGHRPADPGVLRRHHPRGRGGGAGTAAHAGDQRDVRRGGRGPAGWRRW